MNILGLSGLPQSISFKRREFSGLTEREYYIAQGLDAAAALVNANGIVAAAAEERFTRKKATNDFPLNAIRYCLEAAKIDVGKVDFMAHGFCFEPHRGAFDGDEHGRRQYQEVFAPENEIELLHRYFGESDWKKKFVPVPHHMAHAASSYYVSGFDDSLILISDGMGEVQSMTVAEGRGSDIMEIGQVSAFHSLGTLYGILTLYLGFYMNSDEYKVMGLAPYGNPRRFLNQMMEFVSLKPDGTYTVPLLAENRTLEERETHRGVLKYLEHKFGPAREPEAEITGFHKDIAAALQAMLQACQMHVLRHLKRLTGHTNLCLAGGVALNCSVNGAIRRSELFKQMFVQPAAGDDGTALGAALYAQRLHDPGFKRRRMIVPLWGPEYSQAEIVRAVQASVGATNGLASSAWFEHVPTGSWESLCKEVARRITEGQIIGWFQGRMEFGPRALGSRSILADPRDPGMRDRINALVKKREAFRPFAPVVTEEAAARIFEIQPGDESACAHMLYVTHVKPAWRDKLPATTHVDGSARVQTVNREQNPRLWDLLQEFQRSSGIPVLLNTSFNVRGQPMVCTPQEAIETFAIAKLDVLVLGETMLVRRGEREKEADGRNLEELVSRYEDFWVERLCSLEPVSLPHRRKESTTGGESPVLRLQKLAAGTSSSERFDPAQLVARFAGFVARVSGVGIFDLNYCGAALREKIREKAGHHRGNEAEIGPTLSSGPPPPYVGGYSVWVPLRVEAGVEQTAGAVEQQVLDELGRVNEHATWSVESVRAHPAIQQIGRNAGQLPIAVQVCGDDDDYAPLPQGAEIMLVIAEDGQEIIWVYDVNVFEAGTVSRIATQFSTFRQSVVADDGQPLKNIPLMNESEIHRVLTEWNRTQLEYAPVLMHEAFETQAERTPEAVAVVFEDRKWTYRELDAMADRVACRLRSEGVGPENLVGICAEVSLEMMAALLGVLKAGGAYVPLDPDFPKERLQFMVRDSKVSVILTQEPLRDAVPANGATVACLEEILARDSRAPRPEADPGAGSKSLDRLAYVIYTSGSTGQPKGVMLTHRNVANFYAAMDQRIGVEPGVWLAVTTISFDISILELFWTLGRGFKVVLQRKSGKTKQRTVTKNGRGSLDFSLFYFASDATASPGERYRLLLEGAKYADDNGFSAVWTPERHFHSFGGLYPNPSITSAAVAAVTRRINIRAGSVVSPLHNAIRIAEEWAVVDNLSNGRVGISFASGWQVNDFVLAPGHFSDRKRVMLEQIETVRRLWRGEPLLVDNSIGDRIAIRILPRPVQAELPVWVTASVNPDTFRLAGELGANLLTHLLGQSVTELKEKVEIYRRAWKAGGHAGEGLITLMLHTFIGKDPVQVREIVSKPFTAYLRSSADLIRNDPWAFSNFKRPANGSPGPRDLRAVPLSHDELDTMAAHAFDRYFEMSGLFGTAESCMAMVEQLRGMGIGEIGCLIDFGVPDDLVLAGLEQLNELRKRANAPVVGQGGNFSPGRQMVRHGVTHLQCTPSLAAILLEDQEAERGIRELKKLFLGGEALPLSLVERLNTKAEIFNMYGPTETTVWSACERIDKSNGFISIGRPIGNTDVYILDKHGMPVPPGLPGEILIGGAGVARGYLNRPGLTAESFIPNPFKPRGGERLYRTGDIGRYLDDGRIEFLGRLDQQVKLRGFRIELGEIETALRTHPAVRDCVTVVREDLPGDRRLTAYILSKKGGLEPAPVREFLKGKLPEYMVPTNFVWLDAFPLTPNGKIDRKALPVPVQEAGAKQKRGPSSLTEATVVEAMCELLGVKQIGVEENFFELGGNSILATQLIGRLRKAFQWELPLRLVFDFPTAEALARSISGGSGGPAQRAPAEDRASAEAPADTDLPLSFPQERIWFLHQLEPGSHYNDHFDLRITGPLNSGCLARAINEIVRRHHTLRSKFQERDGRPLLRIAPSEKISVPLVDLGGWPAAEQEREAVRVAVADCQKPFDLQVGPLMRATLARLNASDHLLCLTFDHIVMDGWSHSVFLAELTKLYHAYLSGWPSPLPELPIQYTDFAGWQQQYFSDAERIEPLVTYWKQQLAGAPPLLALPTDRPRPSAPTFRGAREFFNISESVISGSSALGRRRGCTLYMVLLTAFNAVLGRRACKEDIVIGSPIANRNWPETESLIGSFMNSLALRADLSGDPGFAELLARVRKVCLDAYAHQDLPFEKLVAELQPVRATSYSPIFQVMFIMQNMTAPVAETGEVEFRHFDIDAGSSKMDLTLNIEQRPDGGADAWFEYATDLFDRRTILQYVEDFLAILRHVVNGPESRLSELPLRHPPASITPALGLKRDVLVAQSNRLAGIPVRVASGDVEAELAHIWSEVLGVAAVKPEDNLFDLGGHSLLITRIISRIRKSFGVEVPIYAFFDTPTLADIARVVETVRQETTAGASV
jgi:natural product biosynthesis luciferase-like monooxygenase protein